MTRREYLKTIKGYGGDCNLCKGQNEPYMVQTRLWNQLFRNVKETGYTRDILTGKLTVHGGFFCCIACFEDKLGRPLVRADFIDYPINQGVFGFDADVYCSLAEEVAA